MLKNFTKQLGYHFKNNALLKQALSHCSYSKNNNELLEFLGDAVLSFIISSELFHRFPKAAEGQLSRLRANLVREETLAELARQMHIGEVLLLGAGEKKMGGAARDSILADSLEAIIGAIYLDSNMKKTYAVVSKWYTVLFKNISLEHIVKDPKSLLQELLQSHRQPLPEYTLIETKGAEHHQVFVVECRVTLLDHSVLGEGTSRRRAEQAAAENVLQELKAHD